MASELLRIILFVAAVFFWALCLGPLILHAAFRFNVNSKSIIILKRNYKFTIAHSMVGAFFIIVYAPMYSLWYSNFDSASSRIGDIIQGKAFIPQKSTVCFLFLRLTEII